MSHQPFPLLASSWSCNTDIIVPRFYCHRFLQANSPTIVSQTKHHRWCCFCIRAGCGCLYYTITCIGYAIEHNGLYWSDTIIRECFFFCFAGIMRLQFMSHYIYVYFCQRPTFYGWQLKVVHSVHSDWFCKMEDGSSIKAIVVVSRLSGWLQPMNAQRRSDVGWLKAKLCHLWQLLQCPWLTCSDDSHVAVCHGK